MLSNLLKNYLIQCFEAEGSPVTFPELDFVDQIVIREDEMVIFPENTFDVNKEPGLDNLIFLGNISKKLSKYFNYFFSLNLEDKYESFVKFNSENGQFVIGGNPEYIKWCIKENHISLDNGTILELDRYVVYRFKGIKILEVSTDKYSYHPIIEKEIFQF